MPEKQIRCANCGMILKDVEHRNVWGDPCCKPCWIEEEEKLNKEP